MDLFDKFHVWYESYSHDWGNYRKTTKASKWDVGKHSFVLILVEGWLGVGLWSWLRDLLILVDSTMLRVGLWWWWLVVGRLYRIRYQGDQWGSSLHWAQTAYLVWKCILSLIILNSLPVTLWLKKKQFHILPMMIHFLCGQLLHKWRHTCGLVKGRGEVGTNTFQY